jgi:hypothetical protein
MAANADPKVALQRVLGTLYDRPIQIASAQKFDPSMAKPAVIAVYGADTDSLAGLMVCSVSAAAYLGASLSLLPKSVADEGIKKNALDDSLLENFREVANICTSLFAEQLAARAHLVAVLPKYTTVTPEYKPLLTSPNRADLTLDIPNYGQGVISIRLPKV